MVYNAGKFETGKSQGNGMPENAIRIGVSACLLGQKVRYNGGHARDHFLTGTLGRFVEYVPVCPEVECGLGVPRESMRLEGDPDNPRLVTSRTNIDHTDRMLAWAEKRVRDLDGEDLCGFVFKSNSPSSGLERVRVYSDTGMPVRNGRGLFAMKFIERFGCVPVEDEGRLHDPLLRENFIERIFAMKRWRELLIQKSRLGGLIEFHTREKFLILAHSEKHYRQMGKLVATARSLPAGELYPLYGDLLMGALRLKSTVSKNTNVLQHLMGFFKKQLSSDEKREMLDVIGQYHQGYVPLIVPITLINHYVRKYDQAYLKEQTYLNPHPLALKLRNHA